VQGIFQFLLQGAGCICIGYGSRDLHAKGMEIVKCEKVDNIDGMYPGEGVNDDKGTECL